jgi:hypothetical protein
MRALMVGLTVLFGVMVAGPASADDWAARHWQCNHGNSFACHRIHLRHRCDNGSHAACRALVRGD